MKALTVEQLIGILNKKPIDEVVFQNEVNQIFEKHGADWFVVDGTWEKVNEAKL